MNKKLRGVKSEFNNDFQKRKFKVETRRTRTPLRFSRRLRQLPPDEAKYFESVRNRLKKEKLDAKHIISKESSTQICHCHKGLRCRKLHYPQTVKNSKELISILSAPKICNKTQPNAKKTMGVPMRVRQTSCKSKKTVKEQHARKRTRYTLLKNIKKEGTDAERLQEKRNRFVLDVLNRGDMKDIEKLHSVGTKTAERIILYRQIKGPISKISELAKMPKFPKKKFKNFIAQNFLKFD